MDIYDFCLFHLFFLPVLLLISPKKPRFRRFLLKNPDFAPDHLTDKPQPTGRFFHPMGRGVAPPPPALPPLEEPRSECYKLFCGCDKTPCFFWDEKYTYYIILCGLLEYICWTFPWCCYRIYAVFFLVNFICMVNSRDFPVTSCNFDGANAEFSVSTLDRASIDCDFNGDLVSKTSFYAKTNLHETLLFCRWDDNVKWYFRTWYP